MKFDVISVITAVVSYLYTNQIGPLRGNESSAVLNEQVRKYRASYQPLTLQTDVKPRSN